MHFDNTQYKQKGFAPILFLVGILVLVAVAGGAYYFGKLPIKPINNPKACTQEAKLCPDGSFVERVGPNCEFAPCPSATPKLTDETTNTDSIGSNWKTFSSKFGYTFKYPDNITVTIMSTSSDLPSLKEVINIHSTDDSTSSSFSGFNDWIYISSNMGIGINDLSTGKEWCNKLEQQAPVKFECDNWDKLSLTEINGYKVFQRSGGRDSSLVRVIYLPYGDYVYEINLDDGDPEKLQYQQLNDQILSTFKFLP